jgi:DNA polymerase III subunit gamma/tau
MSLYLKYRPDSLEQIKGNADITLTLEGMLSDLTSCPHSFLLHGPTGCGKTTIARIISSRLGCKGNDLQEVDSAQFRGIDTAREIRSQSNYMALESNCRVWIIDECHKMTNDAQNGLLKILEDTPNHVYFILCTTEPQKLLPTIKGRCSIFQVKPLSEQDMFHLLRKVTHREGERLDKEIYDIIICDSLGLPRNALQILEQVLRADPERRVEIAQQAAAEQSQSIELCRALLKPNASWKEVNTILRGLQDQDAEGIRRVVLGYCKSVLLKGDVYRAGLILEEFINPFYDSGFPQLIYACYSVIKTK